MKLCMHSVYLYVHYHSIAGSRNYSVPKSRAHWNYWKDKWGLLPFTSDLWQVSENYSSVIHHCCRFCLRASQGQTLIGPWDIDSLFELWNSILFMATLPDTHWLTKCVLRPFEVLPHQFWQKIFNFYNNNKLIIFVCLFSHLHKIWHRPYQYHSLL